ncbi:hypothetical protein D6833_12120 [Candidatus Parcubacteria bacterium]|nr:MAG: hypothetical protein D6833_12120 [Candidatus Parcubacteria bacterium]
MDHFRRQEVQNRARRELAEDPVKQWREAAAGQDEEERLEKVLELVEALPPGQREVVELHTLAGMSMREIAQRKKLGEGAIRTRASRAYAALRMMFAEETK